MSKSSVVSISILWLQHHGLGRAPLGKEGSIRQSGPATEGPFIPHWSPIRLFCPPAPSRPVSSPDCLAPCRELEIGVLSQLITVTLSLVLILRVGRASVTPFADENGDSQKPVHPDPPGKSEFIDPCLPALGAGSLPYVCGLGTCRVRGLIAGPELR